MGYYIDKVITRIESDVPKGIVKEKNDIKPYKDIINSKEEKKIKDDLSFYYFHEDVKEKTDNEEGHYYGYYLTNNELVRIYRIGKSMDDFNVVKVVNKILYANINEGIIKFEGLSRNETGIIFSLDDMIEHFTCGITTKFYSYSYNI